MAAAAASGQMPVAPKIRLGLLGCGGRSRRIGRLFLGNGGYEITAVADYFEDRAR